MKKHPPNLGLLLILVIIGFIPSCDKKVHTASEVNSLTSGTVPRDITYLCIDMSSGVNWAAPYLCPSNQFEVQVDSQEIKKQRRIDSLIAVSNAAGNWLYPQSPPYVLKKPPCSSSNFAVVPVYGTPVNSLEQEIGGFDGMAITFTIYVLQNGAYGGGVFLGLSQGSGLSRCIGFYPSSSYGFWYGCGSPYSNGALVPGVYNDNSGLYYSVSVSINLSIARTRALITYLSNSRSSVPYNYSINYNGTTYALNAAAAAGLSLTVGVSSFTSEYELARYIRTMAAPPNGSVNTTGGITPARTGDFIIE